MTASQIAFEAYRRARGRERELCALHDAAWQRVIRTVGTWDANQAVWEERAAWAIWEAQMGAVLVMESLWADLDADRVDR